MGIFVVMLLSVLAGGLALFLLLRWQSDFCTP